VKPIPIYEINPILENTLERTIIIPTIAKVKPDVTFEGNYPIAIPDLNFINYRYKKT